MIMGGCYREMFGGERGEQGRGLFLAVWGFMGEFRRKWLNFLLIKLANFGKTLIGVGVSQHL